MSLERASARETAIRCAVGAIAHQILLQLEVFIFGYVSSIGTASFKVKDIRNLDLLRDLAYLSEVSCPDNEMTNSMLEEIKHARLKKDTLGGSITCLAVNFPAACGSYVHFDRKLDAKIASSLISIQSVKAVEFGNGFLASQSTGSEAQDQIILENKKIRRLSNTMGGFEGGMSTGEPIEVTSFLKPISTTLTPLKSVDLNSKVETNTVYERSDTCAVPRAVPIFESVISIDLLNSLLEKTGGDSLDEVSKRVKKLQNYTIDDFNLKNKNWKMLYENE